MCADNGIGNEAAAKVAAGLSKNVTLTSLDISANEDIGGEAARNLADAVLTSRSLQVLSEVPIKQLREDRLTELDLSSPARGDLGKGRQLKETEGLVLAELLKNGSALTSLDLSSACLPLAQRGVAQSQKKWELVGDRGSPLRCDSLDGERSSARRTRTLSLLLSAFARAADNYFTWEVRQRLRDAAGGHAHGSRVKLIFNFVPPSGNFLH